MSKKVLYENKYLQVFVDESVPYLGFTWNGFVPSTEFRSGVLKCGEFIEDYALTHPNLRLLGDTQTIGVISREDMKWLVEYVTPLYAKAGAKYLAFIMSNNAFGQLSLNNYVSQTTGSEYLTTQIFDNKEEALDWLKSV
jgi:hypothetical protein